MYNRNYYLKNRDKILAWQKIYYEKNKDKCNEKKSEWYFDNKTKLRHRYKKYRKENKEKIKEGKVRYYKKNRKKISKKQRKKRFRMRKTWGKIIPLKTVCPICGKDIFFNSGDWRRSINFDHRRGGREKIVGNPSGWLSDHEYSERNEKIWKSCDFGMLCIKCNRILPTKNRVRWFFRLKEYVMPLRAAS